MLRIRRSRGHNYKNKKNGKLFLKMKRENIPMNHAYDPRVFAYSLP